MRKTQQVVTKIQKYLHPGNADAELGELTERMEEKGFVLVERTDVKRYGKAYVRFTFDKAPTVDE